MAFDENLRPASFRGVGFFTDTTETTIGRRKVIHQYPLRDTPFTEDLGKEARVITISAHVIGDDHENLRDQLIQAIEDNDSPGTLIHPVLGSILVVPSGSRHIYNNKQGRIEYFQLTFTEAGENQFPDRSVDTVGAVNLQAESTVTQAITQYTDLFQAQQFPELIFNDGVGNAEALLAKVEEFEELLTPVTEKNETFQNSKDDYEAAIPGNIPEPQQFAEDTSNLLDQVSDLYADPQDAFDAYQRLLTYGDDFPAIPLTTGTRRIQAENRRVQIALIKRLALIGMSKTSVLIEYESYEDAVATRDFLADKIDDEILAIGTTDEDEMLFALEDLRAKVVVDITTKTGNLARNRDFILNDNVPALVFSYELYETSERDEEISKRNKVRRPSSLTAGRPIRALVS